MLTGHEAMAKCKSRAQRSAGKAPSAPAAIAVQKEREGWGRHLGGLGGERTGGKKQRRQAKIADLQAHNACISAIFKLFKLGTE